MIVSNSLDPDHDRRYMQVLIWAQADCKGYQQTTKVAASKKRVNTCQTTILCLENVVCFLLLLHIFKFTSDENFSLKQTL